jgi:hypothetical protein
VNCGYDLRTGGRVQYQSDAVRLKQRRKSKDSKRQSDGKPGGKISRIFTAKRLKRLGLASVLFGILVGSIAGVWGVFALYRYFVDNWNQYDAFLRLDAAFSDDHLNAKKLAEDLPHIFAYMQQLPARFPKYAEGRKYLFLDAIHKIPKDTDLAPLLKFPPDSPAYQPIFDLLKQNTDLSWAMKKSCDSSDTARHYGGDLLMASLPFISWSEADKNSLRERTEAGVKESRFRKYAEQSQLVAEKQLPGRCCVQLEAEFSAYKREKGLAPDSKQCIAKIPDTVFEAITKNKSWKVSFFGRNWTGQIEQLVRIDLMCPVKEHQDIFETLPFSEQLQNVEMHLRFKDDKFIVELEGLPDQAYMTKFQLRDIIRTGFTGFQCSLIKAAP